MTTFNWLTLFGVPAIILAVFTFVFNFLNKRIRAIKFGIQAILRNMLYSLFHQCMTKGYASEYEREDFENMYKQYHNLGANGVMDDIRSKFLNLPIENNA